MLNDTDDPGRFVVKRQVPTGRYRVVARRGLLPSDRSMADSKQTEQTLEIGSDQRAVTLQFDIRTR